ncbi:hypothetical protein THASP1DRAFT_33691 [Thamnocephalis sphaerospora]|uniref:SCP domain-containing protein n=1 Tax=Thamnocephalis sphaerospora TaxID=78915 RepID=A0A4P9XG04_9FUNG|nr:hypothetical protein THASP1DRAFT_33691 [Thamnocephalis sphaerospora]|eukprot:RKP04534.1 hypothetical protein THASP1DRAFT_33691 [Thamnocephalis sphaerospora]
MKNWMQSPGHRRNILGSFVHFGSAVAYSQSQVPYYTQDFGTSEGKARIIHYPVCP